MIIEKVKRWKINQRKRQILQGKQMIHLLRTEKKDKKLEGSCLLL